MPAIAVCLDTRCHCCILQMLALLFKTKAVKAGDRWQCHRPMLCIDACTLSEHCWVLLACCSASEVGVKMYHVSLSFCNGLAIVHGFPTRQLFLALADLDSSQDRWSA